MTRKGTSPVDDRNIPERIGRMFGLGIGIGIVLAGVLVASAGLLRLLRWIL